LVRVEKGYGLVRPPVVPLIGDRLPRHFPCLVVRCGLDILRDRPRGPPTSPTIRRSSFAASRPRGVEGAAIPACCPDRSALGPPSERTSA
jgi:hypothetical protein